MNRAARDEVTFLKLEAGSFALVQMKYDDPGAGGCQIPLILAELPSKCPPSRRLFSSELQSRSEMVGAEAKCSAPPERNVYEAVRCRLELVVS